MNDHDKPQNDPAQPDERARELIEQLNLLEAVDQRITPEHVAQRFHDLLRSAAPPAPGDDVGEHRKVPDKTGSRRRHDQHAHGTKAARPAGDPRSAADRQRRPVSLSLSRFLLALVGAEPEILDRVPTERVKFESLGWVILITSGIAVVSMWFALASAVGINGILAIPIALLWGLVIMGIDRWLIVSMPIGSTRRKFAAAAPRLVLAILLGTLISTPLVLRIFQKEINAQVAVIQQQQLSEFLTGQQQSQLGRQFELLRDQVSSLDKVIDSRGQVPLDPTADPEIVALNKQLSAETSLKAAYYREWQCQLYGGPGCPAEGQGPLAESARNSYEQATAEVSLLIYEIKTRESELAAASAAKRLQQAQEELPVTRADLSAAQEQLNVQLQDFKTQNSYDNGLLTRLEALNQLAGKDPALEAARSLLFLLFLLIECLPVTVKLMQQPGNYEKILAREIDMRVKTALIQEGLQRQRTAAEARTTALIREEFQRRQVAAGQEQHNPADTGPQKPTPAQAESGADSLAVPDELRRQIETIYPFMPDTTSETAAPEYREELENCFMAISEAVNELVRRGYDTAQIVRYLRATAQQSALLDEELRS